MKESQPTQPTSSNPAASKLPARQIGGDPGETGLPLLPTWAAVYWFVAATFALWIGLLILLTKAFA